MRPLQPRAEPATSSPLPSPGHAPSAQDSRHNLTRYLLVACLARLTDGGTSTALALLGITHDVSPTGAGLLVASAALPHAIAGPVTGTLADRISAVGRVYAAALAGYAAGLVGVVVTAGRVELVVPAAFAAFSGMWGPLLAGGLSGLIPRLVDETKLSRAYGLDGATYNVAGVVAPTLVAVLALWSSASVAVLALAALLAVAIPAALGLPDTLPTHGPEGRRSASRDLLTSLPRLALLTARSPRLRFATIATTLSAAATGGLTIATVLLASQLGQPHAAGPLLMAGFSLGALAGSLATTRWHPGRRIGPVTMLAASIGALGCLLVATALAPRYPLALALFVAAGVCDGPLLTATLLVRTMETPASDRTALFATAASLKIAAGAGGAALAGAFAALGGRMVLGGIGVAQAIALAAAALAGGRVTRGNASTARVEPDCPAAHGHPDE